MRQPSALSWTNKIAAYFVDLHSDEATLYVIVDQSHGLHERVDSCRSHKLPPSALQFTCKGLGVLTSGLRLWWEQVSCGDGSKRQKNVARDPSFSTISTALAALLITAAILPLCRTMDSSDNKRSKSISP